MLTHYRYKHKYALALREENRLGMFQNGVLRNILQAKRNEVREGWSKLYTDEPHDFRDSSSMSREIKQEKIRCLGHMAQLGKNINSNRVLVGTSEGKRPL